MAEMYDEDLYSELYSNIKNFKEEFDKLDILEQIQFVAYHDCGINLTRECAASYLAYVLLCKGFGFFRDIMLRRKEGEEE